MKDAKTLLNKEIKRWRKYCHHCGFSFNESWMLVDLRNQLRGCKVDFKFKKPTLLLSYLENEKRKCIRRCRVR